MVTTLIVLCIIIISTGQQIAFKLASNFKSYSTLMISLGILLYLLYMVLWFWLLKLMPLGIALPLMSFTYITVAIAGNVIFKDSLSLLNWVGILLITVGTSLIWYEK